MKYIIVVDKQTRTNPSTEKREIPIEIDELRKKGDRHDDLIIENSKVKVIRRIGITPYHVTYILDNESVENIGEIKIPLFQGNNYIYIKDQYNNQMCAEYIIKNDFTDMYVTNLQMSSAIEQTAQSIDLSVDKKLSGYSKTKQMDSAINMRADSIILSVNQKLEDYDTSEEVNSKITMKANEIKEEVSDTYATQGQLQQEKSERMQTATQINNTVSKKVGNDEIISKINQSAEEVCINANKVDLNGFVTVSNLRETGKTIINGSNITTGIIDASKANVTNINASNIKTGTMQADKIKGGTLTVGGNSNGNGSIILKDSADNMLVQLNNNGITLSNGARLIGGNGVLSHFQFNSKNDRYFLGFNWELEEYKKTKLLLDIYIPNNFVIKEANVILTHNPIYWNYTEDNQNIKYAWGWSRNIRLYKACNLDTAIQATMFGGEFYNDFYGNITEIERSIWDKWIYSIYSKRH